MRCLVNNELQFVAKTLAEAASRRGKAAITHVRGSKFRYHIGTHNCFELEPSMKTNSLV